tara:strand:+ start:914 stop:1096 length:183 start_codon:yes stop_codon:yes gene_type:complete
MEIKCTLNKADVRKALTDYIVNNGMAKGEYEFVIAGAEPVPLLDVMETLEALPTVSKSGK